MTDFEVVLGRQPRKFLNKCEAKLRQRLLEMLVILGRNPVPVQDFDVSKVAGTHSTYRIRVQRVRSIYDAHWTEKQVHVLLIERKDDHTYKL